MRKELLKNIFILSITLTFILLTKSIYSQNLLEIKGRLSFKDGGTAKEGAVNLYENGKFVQSVLIDRSGKFKMDLEISKDYIFEFSKDGYVTKKISINTEVPDNFKNKAFTPIYFAVELSNQYEGVNTVVFSQPVGIIKFYRQIGDFDYDVDYSTEMRNKVNQAEKALAEAHKEHLEEERQKELAERQQQIAAQKAAEEAERQKRYEKEKAAAEARRKAAAEAKVQEEQEKERIRKQQEEEVQRRRQEEEARKQTELLEKQRIIEQQRVEAEKRAKTEAEEIARKRAAEEAYLKAEADSLKKLADEKAKREAEEYDRQLTQLKEKSKQRQKEEEAQKVLEEEQRLATLAKEKRLSEDRKKVEKAAKVQAELEEQELLRKDIEIRKTKALAEKLKKQNQLYHQAQKAADEFTEVKKDYSKGKTVEEFEKFGMYITRTIVIDNEAVKIYLKVKHDWGGLFFFKNNQSISGELYEIELERI